MFWPCLSMHIRQVWSPDTDEKFALLRTTRTQRCSHCTHICVAPGACVVSRIVSATRTHAQRELCTGGGVTTNESETPFHGNAATAHHTYVSPTLPMHAPVRTPLGRDSSSHPVAAMGGMRVSEKVLIQLSHHSELRVVGQSRQHAMQPHTANTVACNGRCS